MFQILLNPSIDFAASWAVIHSSWTSLDAAVDAGWCQPLQLFWHDTSGFSSCCLMKVGLLKLESCYFCDLLEASHWLCPGDLCADSKLPYHTLPLILFPRKIHFNQLLVNVCLCVQAPDFSARIYLTFWVGILCALESQWPTETTI